jgi:hypothetical protein
MPPPAEVRAMFSACFDYDEPSETPDPAAVFSFYDDHCVLRSSRRP